MIRPCCNENTKNGRLSLREKVRQRGADGEAELGGSDCERRMEATQSKSWRWRCQSEVAMGLVSSEPSRRRERGSLINSEIERELSAEASTQVPTALRRSSCGGFAESEEGEGVRANSPIWGFLLVKWEWEKRDGWSRERERNEYFLLNYLWATIFGPRDLYWGNEVVGPFSF